MAVVLSACQAQTDAVTAYQWFKQAEPATQIEIIQNVPDQVVSRCPQAQHAGACATIGGPVCVISFARTWNEDWKLLEHELRHCNGWNHA